MVVSECVCKYSVIMHRAPRSGFSVAQFSSLSHNSSGSSKNLWSFLMECIWPKFYKENERNMHFL